VLVRQIFTGLALLSCEKIAESFQAKYQRHESPAFSAKHPLSTFFTTSSLSIYTRLAMFSSSKFLQNVSKFLIKNL
jgi:hypothetical protein